MINRHRPSPSTVIACLALFFAVAGGSAIALQGRNSVDSGDIKPKAVKTSDIANNAVTTKKIKNNHVRAADIQNNAVGTGEIRDAQVGSGDLADPEPVHRVGAPGEPAFGNGGQGDCIWTGLPGATGLPGPAFYIDGMDRVHLSGYVTSSNGAGGDAACDTDPSAEDQLVFVLPPGYRPEGAPAFSAILNAAVTIVGVDGFIGDPGLVPGGVYLAPPSTPTTSALDGISFRIPTPGSGLGRRGGQGTGVPPLLRPTLNP
jgi:hypothetical protein